MVVRGLFAVESASKIKYKTHNVSHNVNKNAPQYFMLIGLIFDSMLYSNIDRYSVRST